MAMAVMSLAVMYAQKWKESTVMGIKSGSELVLRFMESKDLFSTRNGSSKYLQKHNFFLKEILFSFVIGWGTWWQYGH